MLRFFSYRLYLHCVQKRDWMRMRAQYVESASRLILFRILMSNGKQERRYSQLCIDKALTRALWSRQRKEIIVWRLYRCLVDIEH